MSQSENSANVTIVRRPRRWLWVTLTLVGIATASVVWAHGQRPGWAGRHAMLDADTAREHVEFVASFVLDRIDADEAQTATIQGILRDTVGELAPMAMVHRSNRELIHEILLAETIDRQALEQIRQAELELADEASRIFVDAVADVAEQLTEEQRQALHERVQRFHR